MNNKHPLHDDYYDQVLQEVGEVYHNQSGNDYDRHRNMVHNQKILDKKLDLILKLERISNIKQSAFLYYH